MTHRLNPSVEVHFEDVLYGATGSTLLSRLRELPEQVEAVLLIGHNPGIFDLLIEFTGEGGGSENEDVLAGFPTAALAKLRVKRDWASLSAATVSLVHVVLPRNLSL